MNNKVVIGSPGYEHEISLEQAIHMAQIIILEKWRLSDAISRKLLDKCDRQRLEDIIAIYNALVTIFPHNPLLRYGWPYGKNIEYGEFTHIEYMLMYGTSRIRRDLEKEAFIQ